MSDTSLMTREPSRRYRDKEKESLPVNDPRPGAISVQGVGDLSATPRQVLLSISSPDWRRMRVVDVYSTSGPGVKTEDPMHVCHSSRYSSPADPLSLGLAISSLVRPFPFPTWDLLS